MSHPGLKDITSKSWSKSMDIQTTISNFTQNIKSWNMNTLGNIFYRKNKIIHRLKGIQNFPNLINNSFLQKLEQDLILEYNNILRSEEDFWKLKSRVQWLSEGDQNTKFFHTITLNRRRRNRIIALKNNEDEWVYDQHSILEMIFKYYNEAFRTGHISTIRLTTRLT